VGAVSGPNGTRSVSTGTGGDPDIIGVLTTILRARAAYTAVMRAGVEVEYCERRVFEIDRELRAYLADRT